MSLVQTPRQSSPKMATLNSYLIVLREESWKKALRQYWKNVLSRKDKNVDNANDEKIVVVQNKRKLHEKADSGIAIEAALAEEADNVVEESPASNEASVQSALRVVRKGVYELSRSCPIPEFMGDEEVMIRNHATGLNPIDWKSVDYNFCLPEFPWVCTAPDMGHE